MCYDCFCNCDEGCPPINDEHLAEYLFDAGCRYSEEELIEKNNVLDYVEICYQCKGKGKRWTNFLSDGDIDIEREDCPICKGKGVIIKQ